jgi:hypothetical protein
MGDSWANLTDIPRSFMAKHDRKAHAIPIEHLHREVGMTNSARNDLNQNFVWSWRINQDITDDGRSTRFFEKNCFSGSGHE